MIEMANALLATIARYSRLAIVNIFCMNEFVTLEYVYARGERVDACAYRSSPVFEYSDRYSKLIASQFESAPAIIADLSNFATDIHQVGIGLGK
jgi:hypothetical protein